MWASYDCYLSAARDILGLQLPVHEKYAFWEQAAIEGGYRWMHDEFCIVCDFPEILSVDGQYRPHGESGPSHRWRDGWSLWYWHGVAVDEQIIMRGDSQTLADIQGEKNVEKRRVRIERFAGVGTTAADGWRRYLIESGATVVDRRRNDIESTEEALFALGSTRVLVPTCKTGRLFAMEVPSDVQTCENAQGYLAGVGVSPLPDPIVIGRS